MSLLPYFQGAMQPANPWYAMFEMPKGLQTMLPRGETAEEPSRSEWPHSGDTV